MIYGTYGYNNNDRDATIRIIENQYKNALTEKKMYDDDTVVGLMNRVRDMFGYTFSYTDQLTVPNTLTDSTLNVAALRDKLYLVGNTTTGTVDHIYYYAFNPSYVLDTEGDYILVDGRYILANKESFIDETHYYSPRNRWTLTELHETDINESIVGLIVKLNRLIGTGAEDIRDENTILGMINRMKDVVHNIDTILGPMRLVAVGPDGQVITTNTFFPLDENTDL